MPVARSTRTSCPPRVTGTRATSRSLLQGLTPGQREIITLRFIDDHSLQAIGEILDIPLGTVKSRLHKAVEAMRKLPSVKDFFEK